MFIVQSPTLGHPEKTWHEEPQLLQPGNKVLLDSLKGTGFFKSEGPTSWPSG